MENLILQLQTLIDQIEHEGLGLDEVKEKIQEILDDSHQYFEIENDDFIEDEY
jgi:uncharacterized membrane protein YjjP (DUF1212 family)